MSSVVKSVGKVLGTVAKVAAPVVGTFFGPAAGAATAFAGSVLSGGNTKENLTAAATGGLQGALGSLMGGGGLTGGTSGSGLSGLFSSASNGLGGMLGGSSPTSSWINPDTGLTMSGAAPSSMLGSAGSWVNPDTGQTMLGTGSGFLSNAANIAKNIGTTNLGNLLSTGANAWGQYENAQAYGDAAAKQAAAQVQAAAIAADAAKFRPVGVTTNFGKSAFGYDSAGNLTSAGYVLNPQLQAQQNALMGLSDTDLKQYIAAQAQTAPMGQAANTMMGLGNQYLNTSPEQQAQMYMAQQQGLLAPSRAAEYSALVNKLQNQGRGGLAIGGTDSTYAANPEMNAYYNALMQQNNQLAANATQGGMDYAKFGAGMVGGGGEMLNSMYNTQANAYNPYNTTLGGAKQLENFGQGAMDIGTSIGAKSSTGTAAAGNLTAQGMMNAANTMFPANANSVWGNLLTGGSNQLGNMAAQQVANISNFWKAPTGNL